MELLHSYHTSLLQTVTSPRTREKKQQHRHQYLLMLTTLVFQTLDSFHIRSWSDFYGEEEVMSALSDQALEVKFIKYLIYS